MVKRRTIEVPEKVKRSATTTGMAKIPAVKKCLLDRQQNKINDTAKPSQAPRDHVKTRQAQFAPAARSIAKRSFVCFAVAIKARMIGKTRIRYSPSTLGLAKVDTTRPRISENTEVSCQTVEGVSKKF